MQKFLETYKKMLYISTQYLPSHGINFIVTKINSSLLKSFTLHNKKYIFTHFQTKTTMYVHKKYTSKIKAAY